MPEGISLESFLQSIQDLNALWIYAIIFLMGFFENSLPLIPGDTVTVFSAYMVGTGRLNYFLVFLTATLGNLTGFMTIYHFGKYVGKKYFLRKNWKMFPRVKIEKIETWFSKYGYRIILFNRFLSGLRMVISLFAGMTHLNKKKLMLLAFLSACMWDGVLIYCGYLVGDNWKYLDEMLAKYNTFVLISIGTFISLFILWKFIQRYFFKSSTPDP